MRKTKALILAAALLAVIPFACAKEKSTTTTHAASSRIELTSADNSKTVELKIGQTVVILLGGNPSIPCGWSVDKLDGQSVEQVGDVGFENWKRGNRPGGGGCDFAFTFKAVEAGKSLITIGYHCRADKPLQEFAVTLDVKGDPAATQPVPVQTKPATTQPAPVRTMTATIRIPGAWPNPQKVYWRAPDQQFTRYAGEGEHFVLLNATGHPHSALRRGIFDGSDTFHVASNLAFAEHMVTIDLHVPSREDLQHLRDMDFPRMTARGTEVVDGVQLLRYELPYGLAPFSEAAFRTTIWADPQTKRAVRFRESNEHQLNKRIDSSRGPGAIPPTIVEYRDIKFDEPLEDSLFCWPTFPSPERGSVEQEVWITRPPDVPLEKLKISFKFPDGTQLAITAADLHPMSASRIIKGTPYYSDEDLRDLALTNAGNLRALARGCVGKRVRVTLNDLPAQELEVVGPISELRIIYPP